jgi:hypothetical protein
MLKKKRKATEIQPPMGDCSIGTVNISQQASPEPADQDEVYTPPRNTKKQKVEHESSGQGSPEFSKSDLFLEQDDLTKVRPARTASTPPEGVTAHMAKCMMMRSASFAESSRRWSRRRNTRSMPDQWVSSAIQVLESRSSSTTCSISLELRSARVVA